MISPGTLDQQNLGLAPRVGEALGDVVDRPAVATPFFGDELRREGVKVRLSNKLLKRKYVDSALQIDGDRLLVADGRSPIIVGLLKNLERSAGRLTGANH